MDSSTEDVADIDGESPGSDFVDSGDIPDSLPELDPEGGMADVPTLSPAATPRLGGE
jgi:hypothetical protein